MRFLGIFVLFATATAAARENVAAPLGPLGGNTTVLTRGANAYSLPARNASTKHRRSFVVGNSLFKENWVTAPASVTSLQGLGPIFNSPSCSGCHFKDGRGQPPTQVNHSFSSMLVRISIPGRGPHGENIDVPFYGDQINHRAIVGVKPEGDVKVRYEEEKGTYPDKSTYTLLRPIYAFENLAYGPMPLDVMMSPRVAPQVIGLGLLEAIAEIDLLRQSDPDDKNSDGISGRPNFVWDRAAKQTRLGRFGWKANQPSLAQQNAGAFLGDMGITSRHFAQQNCASVAADCLKAHSLKRVEINDRDMNHMNTYMRLLAVPAQRTPADPVVLQGLAFFRQTGCASCHIEHFKTGLVKDFPELSKQDIHPFTDLLLHDMGDGLADNRPDFEADGREWRTPPLWGIGLFPEVNDHTRYLHDGRARSLEEAILWHGGEAESAKINFMNLKIDDRVALIRFLESL